MIVCINKNLADYHATAMRPFRLSVGVAAAALAAFLATPAVVAAAANEHTTATQNNAPAFSTPNQLSTGTTATLDATGHIANAAPLHQSGHSNQSNSFDPATAAVNQPSSEDKQADSQSAATWDEPDVTDLISPERVRWAASTFVVILLLSLAPALLLMTTCFVRVLIVLGLTRQAIGPACVPSNQVLTALALLITFVVMAPVWHDGYKELARQYRTGKFDKERLASRVIQPVRSFMARQIVRTGNTDDVWLFLDYAGYSEEQVQSFDDVPLHLLAPAFLISELKTAFLIGFQLYLPFLAIELLIASLLNSLGMSNLSSSMVSFPFKLLLFVLVDGWHLLTQALLHSFA